MSSPPREQWSAYLDAATTPRDRRDRLVEALWMPELLNDHFDIVRVAGPRPHGEPPKALLRKCAAELLTLLAEQPSEAPGDPARRLIAAGAVHAQPQRTLDSDETVDQYQRLRSEADHAHAALPVDLMLRAYATWRAAYAARVAVNHRASLELATEALELADQVVFDQPSSLWVALEHLTWVGDHATLVDVLRFRAAVVVGRAARSNGDHDTYAAAVDRSKTLANQIGAASPGIAAYGLYVYAVHCRESGQYVQLKATEADLADLAQRAGHPRPSLEWHQALADSAEQLGDDALARKHHLARLNVLADLIDPLPGRSVSNPAQASRLVAAAATEGSKAARRHLGNAAYALSDIGYRQLTDPADPGELDEAARWADVAETAWQGFGTNGLNSLRLMRARLEFADPRTPVTDARRDELVNTMIDVARRATRWNSEINALDAAVELCKNPTTMSASLDAVSEALSNSGGSDRARLAVILSEGHAKNAEATNDPAAWQLAASFSSEGQSSLRGHGGRSPYPLWAGRACLIAARASASLHHPPQVELQHLLEATHYLGFLLTTTFFTRDRTALRRRFAPAVRRILRLAVELEDYTAADLLMEAVRRDRVGTLLQQLATAPNLTHEVHAAAEHVIIATAATPTNPTDDNAS